MRGESRRVYEIVVGACLAALGRSNHLEGGGDPLCANTQLEARDSRELGCGSGNYDSVNNCGLYDDVDFTAQELCCGCGGGFQWVPRTIPTPLAFECVDTTHDQDTSCSQHEQNSSTCGMYVCLHPSSLFSLFFLHKIISQTQ